MTTLSATPTNGKPAPPIELPDRYEDEAPALDHFEPTAADDREAAEVFAEMAAQRFLDASARLTLAELVDHQTDFYRAWRTGAGAMIADALDALALRVRLVEAVTPADYAARSAELDADAQNAWESAGYLEGLAAGRAEGRGHRGPLD